MTGVSREPANDKEGWSTHPLPARIPPPTWWPAATALSAVLMLFGVVTTPAFSIVGGIGLAASIGGWIGEMRHD